MTVLKRLRYLWKEILRREFPLLAVCALPMLISRLSRIADDRQRFESDFVWLTMPFILMGCFAPTPLFPQYFYPLVPFLILAALHALASMLTLTPLYPLEGGSRSTPLFRPGLSPGVSPLSSSEIALRLYAESHGYTVTSDPDGSELWMPVANYGTHRAAR